MKTRRVVMLLSSTLLLFSTWAQGQEPEHKAPSLGEVPEAPPDAQEDLQTQVEDLRLKLRKAEDERHKTVSPLSFNGYADFGFFAPRGNRGVGWTRDIGNKSFPEYSDYSWVFLGDIL